MLSFEIKGDENQLRLWSRHEHHINLITQNLCCTKYFIFVSDIEWKKVGPPNRYSYEVLNSGTLPHSLERFLDLFQSKTMCGLLQKYTDLELTSATASMKMELQRWTPGSYSVSLHSKNYDNRRNGRRKWRSCRNILNLEIPNGSYWINTPLTFLYFLGLWHLECSVINISKSSSIIAEIFKSQNNDFICDFLFYII